MSDAEGQQLPPGWAEADLGAIGRVICGQSPTSSTVNREGRGIVYVSGPEHWDGVVVHANKWTTSPARIVPKGTVFITVKGAGVGTVFPGIEAAIGRDIYAFLPADVVPTSFVTHALRFTTSEIVRQAQGDIPGLSKDHILNHRIAIPPVEEQKRIANKIDELLSDLDAGVAALKRVQAKLKHYRMVVLKAAVEGSLTADWRAQHPGTEPASNLLLRVLAERRCRWEKVQLGRFEASRKEPPKNWKTKYREPQLPDVTNLPELPEGWLWVRLGQLLFEIEAGKSFQCVERPADVGKWGVIKVSAMSWGSFDENENKTVPTGRGIDDHYEIKPGDILLSRANTYQLVGASVLVRACRPRLLLSDKSMRLLHSFHVDKGWLKTLLGSPWVRRQLSLKSTGTKEGMRNVSQENVLDVLIPLAPAAECLAIVEAVEDQLSVIEHLEADLQAKLKSAVALRQSILRHAFTGRLVPQDPNDEPAGVLLKRIAADRENVPATTLLLPSRLSKKAKPHKARPNKPGRLSAKA